VNVRKLYLLGGWHEIEINVLSSNIGVENAKQKNCILILLERKSTNRFYVVEYNTTIPYSDLRSRATLLPAE
jgi:hypothetical protein